MHSTYWQDKVCIVTGASAGLGASVAGALATRGAKLVLVARDRDHLEQTAHTMRALGADVLTLAADVTSQTDVDNLAKQAVEHFGPIDFLCNCAGRSSRGKVIETSPEEFQQLLEINFLAAVRTTRALAATLLKQRGHVVQIGSLASKVAPRFLGAYPASKFALAAYAQQLRMELGPEGLHVLLVCPGPIRREDTSARYAEQAEGLPPAAQQPGGGAKLKGIDPDWLAQRILNACEKRQPELVVPWKVRLLLAVAQLSPRLGDWLLTRATTG